MRKLFSIAAAVTATALALTGCASSGAGSDSGADKTYKIGINQFVQHPALDAANAGFKRAFEEAGLKVEWDDQNAAGEQATALSIAQTQGAAGLDLVFAIATPSAQASAQAVTNAPVLFSAVTDPVEAGLVDSNEKPGGNLTGTSDMTDIKQQFELLKKVAPEAKKVGIVYASGEVNSKVQVDAAKAAAGEFGLEIVEKGITAANEIQQTVEGLGDVDAIYVPTDNMVVAGIAAVVKVAEAKKIPVFGAEAGTVEGGAVATIGIDYEALGYQTGKMAIEILTKGKKPADLPVETADKFAYTVNEGAAERQGVTIPADILKDATKVG